MSNVAQATTLSEIVYWVGGSGTWDTTSKNWSTSLSFGTSEYWSNGDIAVFAGARGETISLVGTGIYASAIDFETSSYVIAGNTLTLPTGGTSIDVSPGINATIDSNITGSFGLTLTGSGILTLGGTNNNYSGGTKINGGTLQLGVLNALPTSTTVTLANYSGATLDLHGVNQTVAYLSGGGTIGGNITLGSGTLTVSSGTYGGAISGSGGVTKSGGGTLILTGTQNNYGGSTTINGGTLQLGVPNALPTSTAVTLANSSGATLDLHGYQQTVASLYGGGNVTLGSGTLTVGSGAFSGAISGSGSVTKSGGGTLILTGTNNYSGTVITQGTLQIGDGSKTNGTFGAGSYDVLSGAKLYLDYATVPGNGAWWNQISGGGAVELNSNVPGNWGTSSLSASFGGTLTIDNGYLNTSPTGLGNATNIVVNSGAQLVAGGGTYSASISIEIAGAGYFAALCGENATWEGPITLTGNATILAQAGDNFVLSGGISGAYQCTFDAEAQATIQVQSGAAQTYGSTEISDSGTVIAGNVNAFSTGPLVMASGNLQLNGHNLSFASLNDNGARGQISNGGNGAAMLTVAAGTYSGNLVDGGSGPLALTMKGTGTLTLSGDNTYSGGANITGGTLVLGSVTACVLRPAALL